MWEVVRDKIRELTGLVAVTEERFTHHTCLVTAGSHIGRAVHVNCDGYVIESDHGLVTLVELWVDGILERLGDVRRLMDEDRSNEDIKTEMVARHHWHGAGDLIAIVANVEKPASLFGTPSMRVFHGATHFPWYAQVLAQYQATRRR